MTFNLKDFPAAALAPFDLQATHPDDFDVSLLDLVPAAVCTAVKRQREALRNPTRSAEELLETLENQGLVQTVARLRPFVELL